MARDHWILQPTHQLNPADLGILGDIPGVWIKGTRLLVPDNALSVVFSTGLQATQRWGGLPLPDFLAPEDYAAQFQPGILAGLMPFQSEALRATFMGSGAFYVHPAGSGKTRTAIVWALSRPGPVVWVSKAGALPQHLREWRTVTRLEPWIWKSESRKRKSDRWGTLAEYLDWCRDGAGIPGGGYAFPAQRPVILVPWTGLAEYEGREGAWRELVKLRPGTVVFDESHLGKSSSRWMVIPEIIDTDEGPKVQDRFDVRDNISAAAMLVSRAAQRRVCTTATPVANRLSDLWAQLDLAWTQQWGGFWSFAKRYCGAHEGSFGMVTDDPDIPVQHRQHTPELQERLRRSWHIVDKATVNAQLPAKRRMIVRVPVELQGKPHAVKAMIKKAAKLGKRMHLEARIIEASARLRPWLLDNLKDWLSMGQGKVLIFCGRQRDVEDWASALARAGKDLLGDVPAGGQGLEWAGKSEPENEAAQTTATRNEIRSFRGDHSFLSNFHWSSFTWDGAVWPTSEHAFQAAKSADPNVREQIRQLSTPAKAKQAGRQVQLISDWETRKDAAMLEILRAKFRDPNLLAALLATGDSFLVEGNTWHDNYWGDCTCNQEACKAPGRNRLGHLLMAVRAEGRNPQTTMPALWASHGGLHGPEEREQIRLAYMAHPGPCVLLGTTDAWGESYDLQDTDVQVIAQIPYTPRGVDQAEGRGHRLGKTRPHVIIYPIPEGTVAERISALLLEKLPDVTAATGDADAAELREQMRGDEGALIEDFLDGLLEDGD